MTDRRPPATGPLVLALGAAVFVAAFSRLPAGDVIERFELRTIDARFVLRGPRDTSGKVVIVEVNDRSLDEVGAWPWPRERFARLVDRLGEMGAAAIAFDILFVEPDRDEGQGDAALADACRRFGRVFQAAAMAPAPDEASRRQAAGAVALQESALAGARIETGRGLDAFGIMAATPGVLAPIPPLARAARGVGFVDAVASPDGVYRHYLPVVEHQGMLYPALGTVVALDALGLRAPDVTIRVGREARLGAHSRIALDRSGAALIDFAGPDRTFPYYAAHDLLMHPERFSEAAFADKIVLIAVTATGLYDLRASPFSPVFNGVETQANALDNLLLDRGLRRQRPEAVLLYTLCWALLIGFVAPRVGLRTYVPLGVGLLLCHNLVAVWHFDARAVVTDMVVPSLGIGLALVAVVALQVVVNERRRQSLHEALARLVPEQVANRLAEDDARAMLAGERRTVTVMFADLKGFTAAGAMMKPEDTVALLNRYFQLMHEVIEDFGGTLDKFIGDEVMAFFNAPVEQIDHAALAVAAALEMQRHIDAHRDEWRYHGMPDLAAGIGIATGEAVVGYVGSQQRMQYTVIGPAVNTASRLEGLAKELGAGIIISEDTWRLVEGFVDGRDRGSFALHGVPGETRAYEVVGMANGTQENADANPQDNPKVDTGGSS